MYPSRIHDYFHVLMVQCCLLPHYSVASHWLSLFPRTHQTSLICHIKSFHVKIYSNKLANLWYHTNQFKRYLISLQLRWILRIYSITTVHIYEKALTHINSTYTSSISTSSSLSVDNWRYGLLLAGRNL